MKFTINNYRGVQHAEIEPGKIAAVFGPNGAGKSSIAGACQACLTGQPLPKGITKGAAMKLVNESARDASVTLESGDDTTVIEWPDSTVNTKGSPPGASEIAVGRKSILDFNQKDSDALFSDILKTDPSKKDFVDAVSHILDEKEYELLWKDLHTNTWDNMSRHYKQLATQKKGGWTEITGEAYGKVKASSFVPEHWSPELERSGESQLQAALVDARERVESVAASNAIDDAEFDRLAEIAKSEPTLVTKKTDVDQQIKKLQTMITENVPEHSRNTHHAHELTKQRDTLPSIKSRHETLLSKIEEAKSKSAAIESKITEIEEEKLAESLPCPHCGNHCIVGYQKLEPAGEPVVGDERAEVEDQLNKLKEKQKTATTWIAEKQKTASELLSQIQQIERIPEFSIDDELNAHYQYSEWVAKKQELEFQSQDLNRQIIEAKTAREEIENYQASGPAEDINEFREIHRLAQKDLDAWKQKNNADRAARTVNHYSELAEIIGTSGIRKQILCRRVSGMNKHIQKFSPWPVEVKDNMSFTFGGRDVALCCESERWRVQTVLQIWIALKLGDNAVIIDRGDILDNKGKNNLFKMLSKLPSLSSIVMFKSNNAGETINLSKHGLGNSYWVESGICRKM